MADILISGGAVITMNPDRAVIDDGAVAIQGDRIVAVGPRREVEAAHTALEHIDASRKVVMPGLIDGHGHAGHGLVKTLGSGVSSLWYEACEKIYAEASDEEFWHQEALLTSLGRLKFGVTCGVSYLGGGTASCAPTIPRSATSTAKPPSRWECASSSPSGHAVRPFRASFPVGTATKRETPMSRWSSS